MYYYIKNNKDIFVRSIKGPRKNLKLNIAKLIHNKDKSDSTCLAGVGQGGCLADHGENNPARLYGTRVHLTVDLTIPDHFP